MLQRLKRRRGGQPGNWNALKHGDRSKRVIEERRAKWRAEWTARELAHLAWKAPIEERCRLQHAEVMAAIERERAERAKTEPWLWGGAMDAKLNPCTDTARAAAAQRQRRKRQRRRQGDMVFNLVLPGFEVIDALLSSGRLNEDASRRRALVEQALADVVSDWASRWRKI
jgi:asparagine synthetase B (glutamine-hydrolysing)